MKNWLIDEARHIWRFWSVRLAMVAAAVAGYFTAYPGELAKLVDMVPEQWRPLASIAVGVLVFSAATGARVIKQKAPGE